MRPPPPLRRFYAYPVTSGVGIIAVVVSLAGFFGRSFDPLTMNTLAFHGEPWRLVTSALPHADLLHLAFNVWWLWVFGTIVEGELGHVRTVLLVSVFAIGSAAAEYALFSGGIGLSGVGYGLFALLYVLQRRQARFRDAMDARTAGLFAGWFVFCILLTALNAWRVANVAHAVGAALGALAAVVIAESIERDPTTGARVPWTFRAQAAAFTIVAVLTLSLVGATVLRPRVNLDADGDVDSLQLAYDALAAGAPNRAIAHYRRALAIRSNRASTWYGLGVAEARAGHLKRSREALARAFALDPWHEEYGTWLANADGQLGYEAQLRGDHADAVRRYEAALRITPNDALVLANVSIAYRNLGREHEAVEAERRALALDANIFQTTEHPNPSPDSRDAAVAVP